VLKYNSSPSHIDADFTSTTGEMLDGSPNILLNAMLHGDF
jgi:hypothetical protein